MITMSSLTKDATEPVVCSMLDGDALTAVVPLEFLELAIEGGENVIFFILEARYPDKDPIDQAGKALCDVFEVSAREGERSAGCRMISGQWCWDALEASTKSQRLHLLGGRVSRRYHGFCVRNAARDERG